MNEFSLSSTSLDDRGLLSGQYWGELRIFAEVARAKSFNRAAERLGLSQPTVGRKVRRLQDIIGAQLFITTKHGVRLTERGAELADAVFRLDQSLFAIASDLKARANEAEGLVSIAITDGLAAFFAAPAVPAFSAAYPKIQLHFRSATNLSKLRENGSDMLLTLSGASEEDCVKERLGNLHFVPVASIGYIAAHGVPTRARPHELALLQSHLYTGDKALWGDWQAVCAEGYVAHQCDNSFAYGMMVRSGAGIGLLGSYTTSDPTLTYVDLGVHVALPMYGVVLRERLADKPVKYAFDWLCATFSETVPCFAPELDLMSPIHDNTRIDLLKRL